MLLRLPVAVMPVLAGPVAGVTVTVKSVLPPGSRELGLAAPEPERDPAAAQLFTFVVEKRIRRAKCLIPPAIRLGRGDRLFW